MIQTGSQVEIDVHNMVKYMVCVQLIAASVNIASYCWRHSTGEQDCIDYLTALPSTEYSSHMEATTALTIS